MSGCWVWPRATNSDGYGHMGLNGKTVYVHRFVYEQIIGPIPEGLELDHTCRNRRCCNPDHLEPVTHRENVLRRTTRLTHCKWGHEYTPENTFVNKRGARECRTCRRRRAA